MSSEEKKSDGLEVLESTLRNIARGAEKMGGEGVTATERMRAAVALAYLLGDIPPPGNVPGPVGAARAVTGEESA